MTLTKNMELLDSFDTIIFSYDYISWGNVEERDKFVSLTKNLRKLKKRIFFVTSDSTSSRREIVEKLLKFEIDINLSEIICVTYLLAKYLSKLLNAGKVFIIGSTGMSEELSIAGIQNFGSGADVLEQDLPTFLEIFANELDHFDAVVIGFDEHLSYPKLIRATTYLNNSETIFLATSSKHPINAFVSCVECSSEKNALIFEESDDFKKTLYDSYNITPHNTLYIGNRDQNDLVLGKRCAFKTLLVSSSTVTEDHFDTVEPSKNSETMIPDFHFQTLVELISISKTSLT